MTTANDPWGRVDADGTVYVRTAEGERVIGSWQAGSPEEALAFFRRKYQSLETEVTLTEQRITSTEIAPAQAQASVQRLLKACGEAQAGPERLTFFSALMKAILEWARLEEKRKQRELTEQKYRDEVSAREKAKTSEPKVLTPETLKRIERELKLF